MSATASITVRVQLAIRRRPGRKTVVTPVQEGVPAVPTRADPALVKALARAFDTRNCWTKSATPRSVRWPRLSESREDTWGRCYG